MMCSGRAARAVSRHGSRPATLSAAGEVPSARPVAPARAVVLPARSVRVARANMQAAVAAAPERAARTTIPTCATAAPAADGMAGRAGDAGDAGDSSAPSAARIQHVFVIALENHDETLDHRQHQGRELHQRRVDREVRIARRTSSIACRSACRASRTTSGWRPARTRSAITRSPPTTTRSASNSTASTDHLVDAARRQRADVDGLPGRHRRSDRRLSDRGVGPLRAEARSVRLLPGRVGRSAFASNPDCIAHHKRVRRAAPTISQQQHVANYIFITPEPVPRHARRAGCPNSNAIQAGDDVAARRT